jgi:hypothetical protein
MTEYRILKGIGKKPYFIQEKIKFLWWSWWRTLSEVYVDGYDCDPYHEIICFATEDQAEFYITTLKPVVVKTIKI